MDTNTDTRADAGLRTGRWAEGHEPGGTRDNRSIGMLLRDLSRESTLLIRQEVALAKAEMREKLALVGRNAAYLAVGAALIFAGVLVFLAACARGLASWLAYMGVSPEVSVWLAPLIVAVIVLALGAGLISKAIGTFKDATLAPKRTVQSLRDTRDWVKEKVS